MEMRRGDLPPPDSLISMACPSLMFVLRRQSQLQEHVLVDDLGQDIARSGDGAEEFKDKVATLRLLHRAADLDLGVALQRQLAYLQWTIWAGRLISKVLL